MLIVMYSSESHFQPHLIYISPVSNQRLEWPATQLTASSNFHDHPVNVVCFGSFSDAKLAQISYDSLYAPFDSSLSEAVKVD